MGLHIESELDMSQPGLDPVDVVRYYIQICKEGRKKENGKFVSFWSHWSEPRLDVNMNGMREEVIAVSHMERLRDDNFYGPGVRWRVIRRICSIFTEVIG